MRATLLILIHISIIINIITLVISISRREHQRVRGISLLSCYMVIYSIGYLLEIYSTTLDAMITALKIENFAIPMIGPIFLYAMSVFFVPKKTKSWFIPVSLVYGLSMFLVVLFNEHHYLYYTDIAISANGFLSLSYGPLFYLQQVVTLCCFVKAYSILVIRFISGTSKLRKQMTLFIIGSLFGFFANLLNLLSTLPEGLDVTPLALSFGLIFFSIDLFHHRLFKLQTSAFDNAMDGMDDGFIVLDRDSGYVYSNSQAKKLFPSLVKFSDFEKITTVKEWPTELALIDKQGYVNFSQKTDDGSVIRYCANVSIIKTETNALLGWSLTIRDVTDMVEEINEMKELAITDSLTGICNRRQFINTVERELLSSKQQNKSNILILFDIDHFKNVNDTYGHAAGDAVLCAITKNIQMHIRPRDLFARIGGEEFSVFSEISNQTNLLGLAEKLRKEVENTKVIFKNTTISITASFGVVSIPPRCSFEKAMHAADLAMYSAKSDGRNNVKLGQITEAVHSPII